VPSYIGLAIPRYVYGSANLVGRHGCVTFRGRCALVSLPACFEHPGFYVENEGLPVGCASDGPAKYFQVFGRFLISDLLEVGMPKVVLPDSLQLCRIYGCLYTPYDQDQHYFTSFIVVRFDHYMRTRSVPVIDG
jgi:hypothetical protein